MNQLAKLAARRRHILASIQETERELDRTAEALEGLRRERDEVNDAIRAVVDTITLERVSRLLAQDAVELEVVQ